MTLTAKRYIVAALSFLFLLSLLLVAWHESRLARQEEEPGPVATASSEACITCHRQDSPALVMEWEESRHAELGVGCFECHAASPGDVDAWEHEGVWVSALVTPKDCATCHVREFEQFSVSEGKPVIDADTWPNSGMGRLNPDGSKGSCHACHSRHAFQASLSRAPENCGKCHMGPDHPQIEVYNESKHGIAFYANRDRMALDKEGDWVLGRDYSAAPTCATCHISSYMTPQGVYEANSHDVGERISWTLRPVISTKQNLVIFEDGFREDYPGTRALPEPGELVETVEHFVENEELVSRTVPRKVAQIVTWKERREKMKGAVSTATATPTWTTSTGSSTT